MTTAYRQQDAQMVNETLEHLRSADSEWTNQAPMTTDYTEAGQEQDDMTFPAILPTVHAFGRKALTEIETKVIILTFIHETISKI